MVRPRGIAISFVLDRVRGGVCPEAYLDPGGVKASGDGGKGATASWQLWAPAAQRGGDKGWSQGSSRILAALKEDATYLRS